MKRRFQCGLVRGVTTLGQPTPPNVRIEERELEGGELNSAQRVSGETALSPNGLHSSRRCKSSSHCTRRPSRRGWLLYRAGREERRECLG